jgi:hypothetical protein
MDGIAALKEQIKSSHDIVESTIADVTSEQAHKVPGGKAHPIGATYAHLLISEDFIVNMICRGSTPLVMGEWAGKTGASEPPPAPGGDFFAWANSVKIDMDAMRKYAQAVYAGTDAYLDSLKAEDLDRVMEVPGFGSGTLGYYLGIGALIHPANHVGEISALKGIQGAKGYPF